ncbi:MAG TPA: glycosyltransferase family 4 protein [Blastocatellia bacterium]|nr:glycosyltransferase family 4 protein [Blastocatellia bacterium]
MAIRLHCIRTRYPHWGAYSGINQFLRYLDRDRFQIAVQSVPDGDEDFPIGNRAVRGSLRKLVQRRGMRWYKLSDLVAETRAFRECLLGRADIIHYLDGEHSAQYLPGLLKRIPRRRVSLVATFHQPAELLDSLLIKAVIARLDCVTLVSPEQAAYFEALLPEDRIRVILHGVDTDYFRPGAKSHDEKRFRSITVGHYLRDFEAVRETALRLQDRRAIEFHIVSSKPVDLEGLSNVIIHKDVGDARLLEMYQQADILFLPLLGSTANNALLEGIACGLPVISTDLPSVRVYLPGEEAILVEKNDPDALIAPILYLFENPDRAACMARQARRRAEELSWRNIAPQYEAIYSQLIDRGGNY